MATNPPIAAFGQVQVSQALTKPKSEISRPETNKYHDLLNAVHEAAFPQGSPDMQSRLEWDNIEGEVMAVVLTQDLISGTMLLQINDPLFHFATPKECLDKIFLDTFVEKLKDHTYLIPSATVMKENLNKLMISYKGFGRDELVKMLQAFTVSLQETEQRDPLKQALRQGRLGGL